MNGSMGIDDGSMGSATSDGSMGIEPAVDGSMGIDPTAARFAYLRIATSPTRPEPFSCVLVGHDHAARVYFDRRRFWRYRCDVLARSVGLGELRALIAYGEDRRLSTVEAARWRERLDWEARLRDPVPLDLRLPAACPASAQTIAEGMALLVGLRDARFPIDEPFVFAYDFARAYCDLTGDEVRSGKAWLEDQALLYRVGKSRRAILWKLAAQPEDSASDRVTPDEADVLAQCGELDEEKLAYLQELPVELVT